MRRHHPSKPWTYALLDARQRALAGEVRAGGKGVLLLSELAPVVTYGRRTDLKRDLLAPQLGFAEAEVQLYAADRGGFATYHGPGQWVAFPVDRLTALMGDPRAIRRAVDGLCASALEVARLYRPDAEIRDGAELGVWSQDAGGKLASVGIHIERGVLLHGVALNVYPAPMSFFGIRPCGLDARPGYCLDGPAGDEVFLRVGRELEHSIFSRFWLKTASSSASEHRANSN